MKQLLVVDELRETRIQISELLESKGYVIRPHPSVARVMTPAVNAPPDLIVFVVREKTYGKLKQLKTHPDTSHIPVLLVVSSEQSDLLGEFSIADETLYLPPDLDELVNKIGNLMD